MVPSRGMGRRWRSSWTPWGPKPSRQPARPPRGSERAGRPGHRGSTGIGRAIALAFAESGAHVAFNYLDTGPESQTVGPAGGSGVEGEGGPCVLPGLRREGIRTRSRPSWVRPWRSWVASTSWSTMPGSGGTGPSGGWPMRLGTPSWTPTSAEPSTSFGPPPPSSGGRSGGRS